LHVGEDEEGGRHLLLLAAALHNRLQDEVEGGLQVG
jgi:hypothetical protein